MRGRFTWATSSTWATSTTWATLVSTVVLVALATALPSLAQPAHESIKLDVGGISRSFLLYRPSLATAANTTAKTASSTTLPGAAVALRTATPASIPLVIMLHGLGGTGANAARETGWSVKAEQEGFAVAYPEATRPYPLQAPSLRNNPQAWNDGSGRFDAGTQAVDDVVFIGSVVDAVTERLRTSTPIDPQRVFVTGFSNGASMAFRVGAELSQRVAAIAPVAGSSWAERVAPQRAVSVLYITGTADPLNPIEGGFPRLALSERNQGGRAKPPLRATEAQWAAALGCPARAPSEDLQNGVQRRQHTGCGAGAAGAGTGGQAELTFITVEGLGHVWAGGVNLLPEALVGKPTDKLKANDAIWDFFRAHPLR
jgi:polyhydroxybutyrate depolymerase